MSAVWWASGGHGIKGYLGLASRDGLEWERHGVIGTPGYWTVNVTGWARMSSLAVVDDFGNLVQVRDAHGKAVLQ